MTEPVRRLGIIADLHCMSRYGLIPPEFRPVSPLPSATFHDYLWNCWLDFCEKCPPLDALIVNGDLIEGENPSKKDAMDAITDDPNIQGDAAVATLSLLRPKVGKLWVVRGTPYHEGKYFETVESVARELGAEQWAPRRWTGTVLEGEFYGLTVNATHHMTIGAIYRGTISDRTAIFAAACERLGKAHQADLIIRSHIHSTHKSEVLDRWVLLTRCWKVVNPYAIKRMEFYRASLLNDIGAHVLEIADGRIGWRDFKYPPALFEPRALADAHAGGHSISGDGGVDHTTAGQRTLDNRLDGGHGVVPPEGSQGDSRPS